MRHFYCSTFSQGYAYKGLLLYESLQRWDTDFEFFMICLDDEVRELFARMGLKSATIITMSEIEQDDQQLLQVKPDRNDKEYIWTAKASVMLHILKNYPETDHIVWLDGDTYFYSDPSPIYTEWGDYSIMLTEERWSKANRHRIHTKGRYNTGFMGFKRDSNALGCLKWFRERLLEWCFDRLENGLWSDQLYVNNWLRRFNNVGVIQNIGVNVGPCIIRDCKVTIDKNDICVNGERLIFYHSYGFRYYDGNEFDLCSYIISFSDQVRKWIYLPYIQACKEMMSKIAQAYPDFNPGTRPTHQFIRNYFNLKYNNELEQDSLNICTMVSKDYFVQGLAMYNSLKRNTSKFTLWILCIDKTAFDLLNIMSLKNVILIDLDTIMDDKLEAVRSQRKIHEFCWTLKPFLVHWLLKNHFNLDSLLYADSDLFFFKDVRDIYREWGDSSIFLTRLWMGKTWTKKVGRFSAGLIGFKRDRQSLKVLVSWKRKCLKWCYDIREADRWGDQMYLDQWPAMIDNIKITENKGINTGPWNIKRWHLDSKTDGVYLNNDRLTCYHFSGFKIIDEKEFELCDRRRLPDKAAPIYSVYVRKIGKIMTGLKLLGPEFIKSIMRDQSNSRVYNHYILTEEEDGET